jgi:hypothetical protein
MHFICKHAFRGHDKEAEVLGMMADTMRRGWFKEVRVAWGETEQSWVSLATGTRVSTRNFEDDAFVGTEEKNEHLEERQAEQNAKVS